MRLGNKQKIPYVKVKYTSIFKANVRQKNLDFYAAKVK